MTEAEWFEATTLTPMLGFASTKASDRKLRLFAVACCRRIADLITHPDCVAAVDLAEAFADGDGTAERLAAAHYAADEHFSSTCVYGTSTGNQPARTAVAASATTTDALVHLHYLAFRYFGPATHAENVSLLREVVGNPFHPVVIDRSWLTSTVVQLAAVMYEGRDFGAMPILADALQDAGCENEDVLRHCRSDGPHVRGCWVVDLLTGRV